MPLLDIDNNTLQIYDKKSFNVKLQDVHYFLITMLLYGVILFLINWILDYIMNNKYKGSDNKQETIERNQLKEA